MDVGRDSAWLEFRLRLCEHSSHDKLPWARHPHLIQFLPVSVSHSPDVDPRTFFPHPSLGPPGRVSPVLSAGVGVWVHE